MAAAVALLVCAPAPAQWITETYALRAGWNAVWLDVDPYPAEAELQFSGLPVESVWAYVPQLPSLQFIQNPDDLIPEDPHWRTFFPPGHPAAFASDLHVLFAGTAYMVRCASAATWTVSGQPRHRRTVWQADAYNLLGFSVDAGRPPTFLDWFAGSAAHAQLDVWRLGDNGQWQQVALPQTIPIHDGEAYWVYCDGASEYQGPVEIDLPVGTTLSYLAETFEQVVEFRCGGETARTVTVQLVSSEPVPAAVPGARDDARVPLAGDIPLTYYGLGVVEGTAAFEYYSLPAALSFAAGQANTRWLELAVDREQLAPADPDAVYQGILVVDDGAGYLQRIGVTCEGTGGGGTRARLRSLLGLSAGQEVQQTDDMAGLWVGFITLDQVSEPNVRPAMPTAVDRPFQARLILHVDGAGTVRLLDEVTILWRDGTIEPDPDDPSVNRIVAEGRHILMTADAPPSLRAELGTTVTGGTQRDGRPFANRLSTPLFSLRDADGNPETPAMTLTGEFGQAGGVLEVALVLEDTDPCNPFHHQYHPQHRYPKPDEIIPAVKRYDIGRQVTLTFADAPQRGPRPSGWGHEEVGGVFEETLAGLRRDPIVVQGEFRLRRVSQVSVLNDGLAN